MTAILYTPTPLDRAHLLRRDPAHLDRLAHDHGASFWIMCADQTLLPTDDLDQALPVDWLAQARQQASLPPIFLGLRQGLGVFAQDIDTPLPPPPGWQWQSLRATAAGLAPWVAAVAALARTLILWHRSHRFCGVCGHATQADQGGHRRVCGNPQCGRQHFPRTDPTVIMRVQGPQGLLLHRQPGWAPGLWSILAGFVEPGETLEEAVQREVMEETGVSVADIRYMAGQPWPYPCSLMLGFSARWTGGDIHPDAVELEDAAWFSRADITARFDDRHRQNGTGLFLPGAGSISRHLIETWLNNAG